MKIPFSRKRIQILPVLAAALLSALSAREAAAAAPVPTLTLGYLPAKGDSLVLSVQVALPAGWYINSNAPLDSFLVATRLETSAPGLAFSAPAWPAPTVEHSDAMAGNMSLFKGPFEIRVTGRAAPRAALPKPPPPVKATLHYQSCDGKMCWPPKAVTAVLRDGITYKE